MLERVIDIGTGKKLLKNVCDFLEVDESGIADFKITDGKEAVLMSLYGGAFFVLEEGYKFKFRPVASKFSAQEPVTLIPLEEKVWSSSEVAPIFARPLSHYFKFFPELNEPKYLFIIDPTNGKYRTGRKRYFDIHKVVLDIKERIKSTDIKLSDCLIWITNEYEGEDLRVGFGEEFWEYIAGIVLRNKGYFVTHYSLGGDDLFAYYIPDYLEKLIKRGFLEKGGFIEELEMLRIPNASSSSKVPTIKNTFELVVIEAESSDKRTRSRARSKNSSGIGQLLGYLEDYNAGFTHGFVAGPFTTIDDVPEENIGLISNDEDGNLIFKEPKPYRTPSEEKIEIIKNVIKCSLLRNLTFEERCELIGCNPTNLKDYFEKILSLDIDTILDKIEEKLKEGS